MIITTIILFQGTVYTYYYNYDILWHVEVMYTT